MLQNVSEAYHCNSSFTIVFSQGCNKNFGKFFCGSKFRSRMEELPVECIEEQYLEAVVGGSDAQIILNDK